LLANIRLQIQNCRSKTFAKGIFMSTMTLAKLSDELSDIDFCMLSTHAEDGTVSSRPMSNNGNVEYDGDSYYYTYEQSRTASDIKRESNVSLSFQAKTSLLGKPGIFIAVQGDAELIHDKDELQAQWSKGLERWFPQGVETPGIVLVKVAATRIHFWDGEEDGEIVL
jgi:general stress protein 26